MSELPDFLRQPHDPRDPSPWLALYLDRSLPLAEECKRAWLTDSSSRSRQFLLPLVRPFARAAVVLCQCARIVLPRALTSSRLLHRLLEWNMRTWLSPQANTLIFRHFHLGSEILNFIARNTRGVSMSLTPLKPQELRDVRNDLYLQHDLNLFNLVIELNRQLREQGLEMAPIDELDFSGISEQPPAFEAMPRRWTNFIDLQTAIELYTPVYQLFLSDNDFWRASNSLQLDETIGLYVAKLLNTPWTTGLINNRHPMVPESTLRAGYRLVLHGLATEIQHAILVEHKKAQRKVRAKSPAAMRMEVCA
ncbi:hypothetical protein HNQ60_004277 [Povalibacter uvarum]|uniref:Uncharacterized protein n=1 Tax=Povalibacter uvarum TaxID=732238 RepID=A0A841HQ99_9GAMM|nr:hypothetical protein [Povalibacter uvarum]MBB6095387.1 hypothetical protein [Povalibacter uvarum]